MNWFEEHFFLSVMKIVCMQIYLDLILQHCNCSHLPIQIVPAAEAFDIIQPQSFEPLFTQINEHFESFQFQKKSNNKQINRIYVYFHILLKHRLRFLVFYSNIYKIVKRHTKISNSKSPLAIAIVDSNSLVFCLTISPFLRNYLTLSFQFSVFACVHSFVLEFMFVICSFVIRKYYFVD